MRGLEAAVRQVLDKHLLPDSRRPLTVGLSGGGDSLALTLLADAWARDAGRDLVILTVDHRLQPESGAWTERCAEIAERLGRPFRALAWHGEKPANGLPAAARRARHRLLAEAAREAGAGVILLGHTADDALEARVMRAAGSTTPEPMIWAPSPAWPEGRGLFVLRPMMGRRRAELRDWLVSKGRDWIDDPANADPKYARSRARMAARPADALEMSEQRSLDIAAGAEHLAGAIRLHRPSLRQAPFEDLMRLLALACVCAGGGERRPATERLRRAAEAISADGPYVATLAGARIEADQSVLIVREAGEVARKGLETVALPPNREVVWDGRFEVTARVPGLAMRPVAGVARRLPRAEQSRLTLHSAAERGPLPAIVDADGHVSCPGLGPPRVDVIVRSLVRDRFRAAAGLVQREPA